MDDQTPNPPEIKAPEKRRAEFAPLPPEALKEAAQDPAAQNGHVQSVAIPTHQLRPFLKAAHALLKQVAQAGHGTLYLPTPQFLVVLTADRALQGTLTAVIEATAKQRANAPTTPKEGDTPPHA